MAAAYPRPPASPEQQSQDEVFARRLQQEEFGLFAGFGAPRFERDATGADEPLLSELAAGPVLAEPGAARGNGDAVVGAQVPGLNAPQQQLRRNVLENMRGVDTESSRILLARVTFGLLEIIATSTILACGWNGHCNQPLKFWVMLYTFRLVLILPLRIFAYRMHHSGEVTEYQKAQNGLKWLNVMTFLWFLVGQSLLFSGKSCAHSAPFVWYYCLVIVVCVYVALALPFLVVLAICLCLPCVLIVYRFLAEPEGADSEAIANLQTHTFERTAAEEKEKEKKKKQKRIDGEKVDGNVSDASVESSSSSSCKALQCAVCIMEYESGDVIKSLPCGHEFHADCIDKWLPLKKICPLCRHDITKPSESQFLAPSAMHRQTGSELPLASASAADVVSSMQPPNVFDIENPLSIADSEPMASAATLD